MPTASKPETRPPSPSTELIGRAGSSSSPVLGKITFLCPKWLSGVSPTCVHSKPVKTDQVRVGRIARARVALADALLLRQPVGRSQVLRVVRQGVEVQRGAVAGEVAGVGRRMRALSAHHRQRVEEGVERVGRVNVQIAEEDVLRVSRRRRVGGDRGRRAARTLDLSGGSIAASAREHEARDQEPAELA